MARLTLKGIGMELDPGETWEEPITFTLRRDEATAVLAVVFHELENNREGLAAATFAAIKGDKDALLAALALTESGNMLQELVVKLTGIVKPNLVTEAEQQVLNETKPLAFADDEGHGAEAN